MNLRQMPTVDLSGSLDPSESSNEGAKGGHESRYKELIAEVAHEVKNPLAVILCAAEQFSLTHNKQPGLTDTLELIHSSAVRINKVISSILENQKLADQPIQVQLSNQTVRTFVWQLEQEVKLLTCSAETKFSSWIADNVPEQVYIDPFLARRVIDNLISNALKCTSVGEIRLDVHADFDNRKIFFDVTDTGIGMSREEKLLLFRQFSQLGDLDARRKGSGLGLYVSKRVANRMMGNLILLHSAKGQGSTFRLILPLILNPAMKITQAQRDPKIAEKYRILVVDDDPLIQILVRAALKHRFPNALVLNSGSFSRAEKQIGLREKVDLLISDVNLEDGSGFDVACLVNRKFPSAKIVVMTASAVGMEDKVERFLKMKESNEFCIKSEIVGRIQNLVI
jgi:CheY-like chemotaxis protein